MFFSYYNYKTYKKAYHQGYLEVDDILIEGTPQHHWGASPTQHFDYGTPRGDFNTPGENEDELSNNGYFKNRKEDSNLQPLVTVHIRLVILRQDQILHACPFSRTKHPTSRPTYKEDKSY